MSRGWIRSLKTRVGQKCSISKGGWADYTVKVYKPEESEEEVTALKVGTQQGAAR